jgi:hypothetical protein
LFDNLFGEGVQNSAVQGQEASRTGPVRIDTESGTGSVLDASTAQQGAVQNQFEIYSDRLREIARNEGLSEAVRSEAVARNADMAYREAQITKIGNLNTQEIALTEKLSKAEAERKLGELGIFKEQLTNADDGRVAEMSKNTIGKILGHRGYDISRIIESIPALYNDSMFGWSERYVQKTGHKPRTNIKAYHNYINKFTDGSGEYYIRFTLHEENVKPGKVGKVYIHSAAVSDIAGINRNSDTLHRDRVIDPNEASTPPFTDYKLQDFLNPVKSISDNNYTFYSDISQGESLADFIANYPEIVRDAAMFETGGDMAAHYAGSLAMPNEAFHRANALGYFDILARAAKERGGVTTTGEGSVYNLSGISAKKAVRALAAYDVNAAQALDAAQLVRGLERRAEAIEFLVRAGVSRIDAEVFADAAKVFGRSEILWLRREAEAARAADIG